MRIYPYKQKPSKSSYDTSVINNVANKQLHYLRFYLLLPGLSPRLIIILNYSTFIGAFLKMCDF